MVDRLNWIDLAQDADTGIESIRAHFRGHAYDPHWHESFLVGVTEQGVQQFHCRRVKHLSTPGKVILLEPGELLDGHAPTDEGFTYSMLYLDPQWLERELHALFEHAPADSQPSFADTLSTDRQLAATIFRAFHALHERDLRIVRQSALDDLLASMTGHLHWRRRVIPTRVCRWWRSGRAITCMPTSTATSVSTISPRSAAWIVSASAAPSRAPLAWRRTPTSSSCAWPRRVSSWRAATARRRSPARWVSPTRATWAAGSAAPIG